MLLFTSGVKCKCITESLKLFFFQFLFTEVVIITCINLLTLTLFVDTDNQRIIIGLKDVNDEPPYFINRPLPMQAVVQLNAPPNTPVFTLQARDPDTDANIHYFIVRDRSMNFILKFEINI